MYQIKNNDGYIDLTDKEIIYMYKYIYISSNINSPDLICKTIAACQLNNYNKSNNQINSKELHSKLVLFILFYYSIPII